MTGYDTSFLGPDVPLPVVPREVRVLPSTHFTVQLDPVRRLAASTAVNIDGSRLLSLPRSDRWVFDARVPESEQTGPHVYDHNDLDRGHLVRRQDPVWGEPDEAQRANVETFTFANAAPQAAMFNQGKELWLGLEDHVLTYAGTWRQRVSVFTGPVLLDSDPVYRGCGIPRQFWKVAVWAVDADDAPAGTAPTDPPDPGEYPFDADDGATSHHEPDSDPAEDPDARRPFTERPFTETTHRALAAAAFVLDQSPLIAGLDLDEALRVAREADAPPPLGPFRTFQVPVSTVASLSGLDLGPVVAADVLGNQPTPEGRQAWITLTSPDDVVLY
ncbi:DNA/RNA non-specific endonuclease [Cellulomonas sp.]|uniref:DNA/RNA non-specific endonuclease n=1 Tax=Cellulomonas sp. TaxID=40001 RepID=UPI0025C3BC7C|nr:DNA/RNA non-specific endonuclease [Cellulomonas sp.]